MSHRATLHGLVRTVAAGIPAEGRLEVKVALAAHLLDDVTALEALGGPPPGEPPAPASLRAAYEDTKPALAAALRADAAAGGRLDLLLPIAHQQERHTVELLAHLLTADPPAAGNTTGAARDAFVVDDPPPGPQRELADALDELDAAARRLDARAAAAAAARVEELDARLRAEGTPWGSWIAPPER